MFAVLISIVAMLLPAQAIALAREADEGPPVRCKVKVQRIDEPMVVIGSVDPQTIVPGPAGSASFIVLASDDEDEEFLVQQSQVWIGVRITAVPKPLAAHVGDDGVMVINVVKGSPADQSGLRQYDVVVKFAGEETNSPSDLTAAVGDTEPGKPVKMTIIREGARRTLKVSPIQRPDDEPWGEVEMKYEEPAETYLDEALKMRGQTLHMGPQGQWTIKDLGTLHDLPDALKALEKFNVHIDNLGELQDGLHEDFLRHFHHDIRLQGDDEGEAEIELKIRIEEDGETTAIQVGPDGEVNVSRVDADGNESSAVYDNDEALKAEDPEAFELYRQHCVEGQPSVIRIHPPRAETRKLRKQFQVDVEQKLQEAVEAFNKQLEKSDVKGDREKRKQQYKQQYKIMKKLADAHRKQAQSEAADGVAIGVRVDSDGRVRVFVRTEGGDIARYEFKCLDDFKAAERELYEQARDLLE